jgi:hypothetical protein
VGLCSYLLIGFWYEDPAKASAGKKAFVVNRVGDFGFLLGLFLLFWSLAQAGEPTINFVEIAARAIHRCSGEECLEPAGERRPPRFFDQRLGQAHRDRGRHGGVDLGHFEPDRERLAAGSGGSRLDDCAAAIDSLLAEFDGSIGLPTLPVRADAASEAKP